MPRALHLFAALLIALPLLGANPPQPAPDKPASSPPAAFVEAQMLLDQRRYELAVDAFKKANRLAGGSCVECLLGLARACNQVGAFADAIESSQRVLSLSRDRALLVQAHNQLGLALLVKAGSQLAGKGQDDLAAAEQAFRKVLELSGGGFELARFNLGTTLLKLGRDKEGTAVLEQFLEEQPAGPTAQRARSLVENPRRAREDLAPGFSFVTLDGRAMKLDELAGKVVLIDFWGTWCAPCREALPTLKSLHGRFAGSQPFVLLGVEVGTPQEKLEAFVAENKMGWPQVADEHGEVADLFGVRRYPSEVLIDPEGRIVYRGSGWSPVRSDRELKAAVGHALQAAAKTAKAPARR